MTVLSLLLRGGILMYVLLLISIAVIAIVIEKYRQIFKVKKCNRKVLEHLEPHNDPSALRQALSETDSDNPMAVMLGRLFYAQSDDGELITQSMETAAQSELHKLEKGLGWLSTFAAIAPLIGFLGTVIGMVRVFMNIQIHSSGGVDISMLAGGIWEALLTTVGGLIVGIVAIIFYNDIVQNLENIVKTMQESGVEYTIRMRQQV
ncbi:MAG: MotA/TolQ/ExbB proton channel family protein [Candidatus Cloacimonadales bacterium]|jgi:biopolymer transport protein ExbB|nr:MotA/TolQ/ExbB proton channel family protein [Candidatus Cloacimonadota bacterium]MDY0380451.1 MotA/TolQ/ExbB proton channel family protein [Candidatus Cloacimonadaceae bacterium]MCB5257314.1 MotA/TolQ/ExbB proton channel family protein [Candidatus Cloacimonadota bacterium]MCB5263444.1 MotA/TolQ/ExbB proton channel family protein [Candidatus Cloacimonadota bacterium]MCB5276105.1 MotA/TolQ/ExbB proton channel family protein [Candidatus Cloacimonadota bacterium]